MTKHLLLTTILMTSFLVTPAAQANPKYESGGYIELSYIDFDNNDSDLGIVGDFDISYAFSNAVGVDFGLEGMSFDGIDIETVYLAGTYTVGNIGKFSVGAPRIAYDSVNKSRTAGTFNLAGAFNEKIMASSFMTAATFLTDEQPYGLRYDGEFGKLDVTVSAHRMKFNSLVDIDTYALALSYQLGIWSLQGGYANSSANLTNVDVNDYSIGGHVDLDKYLYGISYHRHKTSIGAVNRMVEGYFTYVPTQNIEITATIADFNGNNDTSYGVSGKYTFWRNAYGEIAAKHDAIGSDIYEVNLGWDF